MSLSNAVFRRNSPIYVLYNLTNLVPVGDTLDTLPLPEIDGFGVQTDPPSYRRSTMCPSAFLY